MPQVPSTPRKLPIDRFLFTDIVARCRMIRGGRSTAPPLRVPPLQSSAMKKLLIVLALLVMLGLLAVFVGARILGPRFISVAPPSGNPIGEYDAPRPETSFLGLAIAVPTSLLDEIANAEVPQNFTGSEAKNFHKRIRNGAYAWDVVRGEIRFRNTGSGLALSVPFEGKAKLQGNLDAAIVEIPLDGNADVAGTAGGTLAPEVMADWNVNPNFTPELKLDKAALQLGQLGRIDIGDFLGGSLGQYLQKEARKITPALRKSLNLRREVTKLWNEAHLVEQVSDDPPVWAKVTPRRLLLGPIDYGTPDQISLAVAIETETYLVNRVPEAPTKAPLPELSPLAGAAGTDLRLPVVVSMAELNEVLAKEEFDIDTGIGTKVRVHGLAAEVGQGGYLNLKLDLEADKSRLGRGVAGTIWVRGRPVIDYEKQTLGFSGVELTVETRDKLTGAAAWLLEGLLVKGLEAQLRVDLNDYKAELDEEVQKAIAKADLPEGIDVSLRNLDVHLVDIYTITRHVEGGEPDPGIVVVVRATGDMSTRINRLDLKRDKAP